MLKEYKEKKKDKRTKKYRERTIKKEKGKKIFFGQIMPSVLLYLFFFFGFKTIWKKSMIIVK